MKRFNVLVVCLAILASFAFSQNKGFEFGLKYETYSYTSDLSKSFNLVDVSHYDWHLTTDLRRLQGPETVSRLLFKASYSFPKFRISAIVGVGNLACDYDGTTETTETIIGWSGKTDSYKLFSAKSKSDLGMVLGGEFNWDIETDLATVSLNARYLWQDETPNSANLRYRFDEGSAYMQYGYYLERADIQKSSCSELLVGVAVSKAFGNWILSGGPKAVFLETTHKGTGHWENKFQNFQFGVFDSFRAENDFKVKTKTWGFIYSCRLGYQVGLAEAFVEARIGFASGVSAGLNFKLF